MLFELVSYVKWLTESNQWKASSTQHDVETTPCKLSLNNYVLFTQAIKQYVSVQYEIWLENIPPYKYNNSSWIHEVLMPWNILLTIHLVTGITESALVNWEYTAENFKGDVPMFKEVNGHRSLTWLLGWC